MTKYKSLAKQESKRIEHYRTARRRQLAILNNEIKFEDEDQRSYEFDQAVTEVMLASERLHIVFGLSYEDCPFQATVDQAWDKFWELVESSV